MQLVFFQLGLLILSDIHWYAFVGYNFIICCNFCGDRYLGDWRPTGMEVCIVVKLRPGSVFCPFGGDIQRPHLRYVATLPYESRKPTNVTDFESIFK